ncbi:MAG: hypothetical protein MUF45_14440 [Spirosomaceae bacterium]|jgi:sugar lactone lactonase YvrE|nr:hypothetical protein [Spirosomataceae bacterium]
MKKLLILITLVGNQTFAQKLEKIWETDTTIATPESVLYDKKQNCLFVSCINGTSVAENQNSFVAKIGLDGKIQTLIFTGGLNAIKGMGLIDDKLYVAGFFAITEIDSKTGKILGKYDVPEAKMLNDITVDEKTKTVYVTDMRSNRIWKLKDSKLEKVLDGNPLINPNGLFYENNSLLIGNGDGVLYRLNLKEKQLSKVAEGMAREGRGIDGIEADGKSGYFVTEWLGKLWSVAANGNKTLLVDSMAEKINTADIEYIPSKKLLLVPTFFKNKVMAYRVIF